LNNPRYSKPELFEAFVKSTQYLVRLKGQQNIWEHLGKFIITYFPADWAAFVERDELNGNSILHCTLQDPAAVRRILTDDVRAVIADVLDSGFLTTRITFASVPSMTAFLPVVEEQRSQKVMLIGRAGSDPLSKELLNIYLAIAGLAGATSERLCNERELSDHRAHLEDLVKERTAELAKAKRHNELILNSVGEGICGIDLDGRITFVNPAAAQLIGWAAGDLIGRNSHDTFHHRRPDGRSYPADECPIYSAMRNGDMTCMTTDEFLRRDGKRFPVEFVTAPIIEENRIIGSVLVFRDITQRRRAEKEITSLNEELRNSVTQLEAANEELEAFSYSVSHDLRTPLRSITGFSQVLVEDYAEMLDAEGRDVVHRIIAAARRMDQLIIDLLNLSRVTRSDLRRERVDLTAKAKIIADELQAENPGRKADFIVAADLLVEGDGRLLRQVLENLLGNAWKFTEKTPAAKIEFGAVRDGDGITYFVKDNGVGFDMAYAGKLFSPFQRLHKMSEYSDTGIGLATVKRIIERHGGRVWIEGEEGKGATVYFALAQREKKEVG
jgi:PAS domain S-box-containing protein